MDKPRERNPLNQQLQEAVNRRLEIAEYKGEEIRVPEEASDIVLEAVGYDNTFEVCRDYTAKYMRGRLKRIDKNSGLPIWLRIGASEIEVDEEGETVERDTSYYKVTRQISAEELAIGTRDLVRRLKGPASRIIALFWFAEFSRITKHGDRRKALWLNVHDLEHLTNLVVAFLEKIARKRGGGS